VKLVAYLRVSTERQAEEGLGLDVQARGIRRWARDNGHRIVMVARDEGLSGSNGVDTRLGLHDALAAVRHGPAQGLVVYRLDRLARKLTVQEATLAKVWDMGATVFAVDIGEVPRDDPDDPMKTALRQMVGVFAQLERGMISARLRSGRLLKAERGGYAGFGAPPYGSRAVGGELVSDAIEQQAIDRARTLRLSGASLRIIGETLAAEGYRPRRSDRWHPETLRRLLERTDGPRATSMRAS
jgi:DNA invertase Pin-like site-specific DNA recombinase